MLSGSYRTLLSLSNRLAGLAELVGEHILSLNRRHLYKGDMGFPLLGVRGLVLVAERV